MSIVRGIIPNLKWRTKLLLISLLAVLVVGSTMFLVFGKYRERLVHYFIAELSNPIASALTRQLEHNMEHHLPEHFQTVLTNLQEGDEIHSVRIYGKNGRIRFSRNEKELGKTISTPSAEQAFHTNDGRMYFFEPGDSLHLFRVVSRIGNSAKCQPCHGSEDQTLGFLDISLVGTGEREIEARLVLFDFVSFYSVMIIFCIAILLIHRRYVERPLTALREGVDQIKMGNLNTRLPSLSPGELGRLSDDINVMARDLERARNDLASLYQEQMDRAGQLATVGELAASVAHEIKNPIAGIKNSVEIILDDHKDLREKPILKEMLVQADRMITTIENLMNFAKPRKPKMEMVDVCDLLRRTVTLYREQFQRKRVELAEDFQAGSAQIVGDQEQLKQVFANLLINAFQSIEDSKQGRIILETTNPSDRSVLSVSVIDNGSGIAKEDLPQIFRPFYTTKAQGSGLGLSLCKSLVQQHAGEIFVSSSLNRGSTFTVELALHRWDV
jgi:signal transduction histidine kinase